MGDFGFAFNDMQISDPVLLRIEEIKDHIVGCKRKSTTDDESNVVLNVTTTLNISCCVLATQSPFFYKLLEKGSKEVTLKINASDKEPFVDVLNFMYIGNLSATTDRELQAVRIVAEKYEVTFCIAYCNKLLNKSRNPLKNEPPLKKAAENYLIERYKDFIKSKKEAMALPLCVLEVILGSDGLQVVSEDQVFNFILDWGREHYPGFEERREILTKRLARLIYFPYMCSLNLKQQFLMYPDFDGAQELVWFSLQFNAGFPYDRRMLVADYPHEATSRTRLIKRVYMFHPVMVDYFEGSAPDDPPRCAVHYYLTKEDCNSLFRSRVELFSRECSLLSQQDLCFYVFARCDKDQHTSLDHLGLYLYKTDGAKETCTIDFEFQVMKDPSKGFEAICRTLDCTLTDGDCEGNGNVLGISWDELMAEDNEYFIDGILHLLFDITHKHYQSH